MHTNRRNFIKKIGMGATALSTMSFVSCAKKRRPNFLFILADDLGWMDLACYGSTFYETPNIDRLASQGMRFTDAYAACPVCSPTRASILTGKYPTRINLTDWIPGRQSHEQFAAFMPMQPPEFEHQMALDEVTLAEALKASGYITGFFGKWHLGQTEATWPEHQGFDVNKGGWKRGAPYYRQYNAETDTWTGESGFFSPYENPRLKDGPEGEYLTDRLSDETIRFIRQNRTHPFLAYLSFYTVHNPLHGKKEWVEKYTLKAERMGIAAIPPFTTDKAWMNRPDPGVWRERLIQSNAEYAAMIESLDQNVGRVLDALEEQGLAEHTIVFFMSDNGGLSTSEGAPTTNFPLRSGKGWLYEGGIRAPMIVKWPGVTVANTACRTPVISTDFYPTMLDMAGLPAKKEQHVDGLSLVPLLKGGALSDRPLFWHYPHYSNQGGFPGAAVRLGDYKLIESFDGETIDLYNLAEDVGETRDLSEDMPEKVRELSELLHKWQRETGARFPQKKNKQ